MIRTALILTLLSGCASFGGTTDARALCQALAPDMPLPLHYAAGSKGGAPGEDQPDTIERGRRINARYKAICP